MYDTKPCRMTFKIPGKFYEMRGKAIKDTDRRKTV